jgi:hypothetical protein
MSDTVKAEFNIELLKAAIDEELSRILIDLADEDITRAMELGALSARTNEEQAELDEINGRILESPMLEIVDFSPLLGEFPLYPLHQKPKPILEAEVE